MLLDVMTVCRQAAKETADMGWPADSGWSDLGYCC